MKVLDYVKLIFENPDMDDGLAEAIIWGCTGFPAFWIYDPPMKCFTDQLRHAKRSLARGFTIDEIFEGKDKLIPDKSPDTTDNQPDLGSYHGNLET